MCRKILNHLFSTFWKHHASVCRSRFTCCMRRIHTRWYVVQSDHYHSHHLSSVVTGKRIITADADGTLIFWDPRSPKPVWTITPEDGRFDLDGITSLAVNPASTVAVVGGASGGIRVVNLNKGDLVGLLAVHKEGESVEAIAFVGFAGAAEVVVTGSTDGMACVWDLNTLKVRNTLKHEVSSSPFRRSLDLTKRSIGTCYLPGTAAGTQVALCHLRIGRQCSSDMGHTYWYIDQGTQRPPRPRAWCGRWARGQLCAQRWR